MSQLFSRCRIHTLTLPNRLVRSATAERLGDEDGRALPRQAEMYRELVRGGVGLIITGHLFVARSGIAHPEMVGIHDDSMIPSLAALAGAVHEEGGKIAAQINHGGAQCFPEVVSDPMAPSAIESKMLRQPAREITTDEIEELIDAYRQAARRARQAGFDAVQIHAAHGYLISEFLSPFVNRREDQWGGDRARRRRMLQEVCRAVRREVGPDYPVFVKLGVIDGVEGGLTLHESLETVAELETLGLDAVEVSGGFGGRDLNSRAGVGKRVEEAYFREEVRAVRQATRLPVIMVGGMRSRRVMDEVLANNEADFISLCRPLICEPDLPNKLRTGKAETSACRSGNRCWPLAIGEGVRCREET
ncbi:MAG: NADH:flavin oxidoreductase [Planctomycetota bacterium]